MSPKKIALNMAIGFFITILCNVAGVYFISEFSDFNFFDFINLSLQNGSFSGIVALGALMDFLPFFVFLRKGNFYKLRGVLLGVLVAAATVLIFKYK